MVNPDRLHAGAVVIIAAFDEVPEHQFVIHTVELDCVTGTALTGPLAGSYGEPGIEMIKALRLTPLPVTERNQKNQF